MAERARRLGVPLRPHLKTAKSAAVAALVREAGATALTVSTLREAEYFFAEGWGDLLYAVTIEPGKFARAAALLQKGADLIVTCDSVEVARGLAQAGRKLGVRFPVLVEIDCGEHRSGIAVEDEQLLAIAAALRDGGGTELRGICSHSGHSYSGRTVEEHRAVAAQERAAVVRAAERLRGAGHVCTIVSLGSTPAALHAADLAGVTELRCGVYMFNDLFQAGIGSCTPGQIAVSVLTAVIGHRPQDNILLVDAGSLALSKDISTNRLPPTQQAGYGVVLNADGSSLPGWVVATVYQEHGLITSPAPIDFGRFPIGTRLRILPNHACLTAAAYEKYLVVAGNMKIVDEWPRLNGW